MPPRSMGPKFVSSTVSVSHTGCASMFPVDSSERTMMPFRSPYLGRGSLLVLVLSWMIMIASGEYKAEKSCGEITENTQLVAEQDTGGDDEDEEEDTFETRVRMGTAVTTKRYPWMVAIQKKGVGVMCAGSLITKRYVLTAAHCFFTRRRKGPKASEYLHYIGFLNLSQKPIKGRQQVIGTSKIHMHPTFDIQKHTDDLALIRLDEPVAESLFLFKTARTICLPQKSNIALKKTFTVAGWGNNGTKGVSSLEDLYEAQVDLSTVPCPKKNICTRSRPSDVCENDSGGPLMQAKKNGRMQLIGVVSHGPDCWSNEETGDTPGVFADVRKYMNWIKQIIAKDEKDGDA